MGNCQPKKRQLFSPKFSFGSQGDGPGEFTGPSGVCVNSKGHILVTDTMNGRVEMFDKQGRFMREFGQTGREDTRLNRPVGIVCDENDNCIVTDSRNHSVKLFDDQGIFIQKFGFYGKGKSRFDTPTGVCLGADNNILICDYGNKRVQVFSPQGKNLFAFGKGVLKAPVSCAYNGVHYFVSDEVDAFIYMFDESGKSLGKFGAEWLAKENLKSPAGLSVYVNGDLLVCDRGNSRVLVCGPEGTLKGHFGSEGRVLGQFQWPQEVSCSQLDGRVFVCDRRRHQVIVFQRKTA